MKTGIVPVSNDEMYLFLLQHVPGNPRMLDIYRAFLEYLAGDGQFEWSTPAAVLKQGPGDPGDHRRAGRGRPRSGERMMAMLGIFFAGCALLVTAIGLYGTLAYATARRTSEIGIRIALGAQVSQVSMLVFRQGIQPVFGGLVAGVAAALGAGQLISSFLFGTEPRDPPPGTPQATPEPAAQPVGPQTAARIDIQHNPGQHNTGTEPAP